jgi:hypothetical protein
MQGNVSWERGVLAFEHMQGRMGMECHFDKVGRESVCGKRGPMDEVVRVYDGAGKVWMRE